MKYVAVLTFFTTLVQVTSENPVCGSINNKKSFSVNFKNGTNVAVTFNLSETDKDMIDFTSRENEVVLRLEITGKTNNSNMYALKIMSLRGSASNSKIVGPIVKKDMTLETKKIGIHVYVKESEYNVKVYNYKGNKVNFVVEVKREHFMPYQIINMASTGMEEHVTRVCNNPDECRGVCITCPRGTRMERTTESHEDSKISNSTHVCIGCKQGHFSTSTNTDSCESCTSGQYAASFYSKSCQSCGKGNYTNVNGSKACSICGKGYFTDKELGSTACSPCSAGTFSEGATNKCKTCPDKAVSYEKGSPACTVCEYDKLNATHCSCPRGTARADHVTCSTCSGKTYTPRENMAECLSCNGTVNNHTCTCEKGYHLVEEQYCVPRLCSVGMFMSSEGNCELCPRGTYNNKTGASECAPCSPGSYQPSLGSKSCIKCDKGTAQSKSGKSYCVPCRTGTYQDKPGQVSCEHCYGTIVANKCHKNVFECSAIETKYENVGRLSWKEAKSGEKISAACPQGGTAYRRCIRNRWSEPDLSECHSEVTKDLIDLVNHIPDTQDASDISNRIKEIVSENITKFAPRDIDTISTVMEQADIDKTKETTESILNASIQIMKYDPSLENVVDSKTKKRVVELIERSVDVLIDKWNEVPPFEEDNPDITITVGETNRAAANVKLNADGNRTYSIITYKNSKLFSVDNANDEISSHIYGVNMHGIKSAEGSDKTVVEMVFAATLPGTTECRWFDTERMEWSTGGCYIESRGGDGVVCKCHHLTSFAIFTSLSEVPENHRYAQSVLTTLLFIISIVSLIITLAVYIPLRSLRNKVVVKVEIMEIIALILANMTFLVLSRVSHQSRVCHGLVFALQYFYLVTMAWSLVASWTFYGQIVKAIHTYGKSYENSFVISFILCWTLPAVVPTFAIIYSAKNNIPYVAGIEGEFGCWIDNVWKTYTFIIPILVIVSINTFLGIKVILVMLRARARSKTVDKWENYKRHIKSIISLLTIFGTSFLLALFTYGPHSIVFQYIFICFTCTQGFWIFVFFVPLRPEVHTEWRNFFLRNQGVTSPSAGRTTNTESTSILAKKLSSKQISSRFLGLKKDREEKLPLEGEETKTSSSKP